MMNATLIALIPLLPLAGFVLLGLAGNRYLKKGSGLLATGLVGISTALALWLAYQYFSQHNTGNHPSIIAFKYTWLAFNDQMSIDMGAQIDSISVMMLVVVTFVSLMVHIYSLGYMKGEDRYPVYYAYLGLFTFSMLGLVISSNIFQIYMFWELVGLSSFLLIGFYYKKPEAVAACKKAFIVTRFADLGFLIGILILSYYAGSFDFNTMISKLTSAQSNELNAAVGAKFLGVSALSWGLMLVFMGGAGKSAMFPLHIWLPDAMEGPTPVSALIHAATMVVAGVFLVARLFPVFAISAPDVLSCVGWVGAFSALFAAIIACTQTDIKRVLAYSTMSQIGFMMFALGVSRYGGESGLGYTASMFHLFTHAMFKALLFLGAGAVIHYVHSNEMQDMGGLRKKMPITHLCFLVACLAIAGIPPFAGFFSKEEILLAAYQNNPPIYWIALITSGLTAFYMFRLYFRIFWNRDQKSMEHKTHHAGEGGLAMIGPLVILAAAAALAGFIPFGNYVSSDGKTLHTSLHLMFSIAPVALGLAGILFAAWMYMKESGRPDKMATSFGGIYRAAYRKFYIDEIYQFITQKIIFNLIGRPAAWFDKNMVDGAVNLAGTATENTSDKIKKIQSGKLQSYAMYILVGVLLLSLLLIYIRK